MRPIDADHFRQHLLDIQSKCAPGGVFRYTLEQVIKILDEEPCVDEPHDRYTQRALDIYRKRNIGMTFEEIGKEYGITRDRVRQIYLKECRRREKDNEDELNKKYAKEMNKWLKENKKNG